ncbi:MAG: hypothetical protein LQ341_002938 [Variospora aurantia]|nr:MAG: hypothetical protein LQ341_002938 [Variospora aurantia]
MPDDRNEENTAVACHYGNASGEEQELFKLIWWTRVPLLPATKAPRRPFIGSRECVLGGKTDIMRSMQAAVELIYILEEYTRLPKKVGLSPENARSAKRRVGAEVRASGANEVTFCQRQQQRARKVSSHLAPIFPWSS